MSLFKLYLFLKMSDIAGLLIVGGLLFVAFYPVILMALQDFCNIKIKASYFLVFIIPIFMIIIGVLLPNTKQMAVLYIVPRVATASNIDKASQEFKELYPIAKDYLIGLAKEQQKQGDNSAEDI